MYNQDKGSLRVYLQFSNIPPFCIMEQIREDSHRYWRIMIGQQQYKPYIQSKLCDIYPSFKISLFIANQQDIANLFPSSSSHDSVYSCNLISCNRKPTITHNMTHIINLQHKPPTLTHIKTITQILPYKANLIIMLGHSPDSLKKLQLIYQIYDAKQGKTIKSGIISKFGVIFLTSYVLYDVLGSYITLVSISGSKRIVSQGFGMSESKTVVGEVRFQKFEQHAKSESYVLYYSPIYKKIYVLEHLKFSEEEHQIFLRAYEHDKEVLTYRIIALEQQLPQIICSPKRIIFVCGMEITVYKERLEPQYFAISNMEQFEILGFYHDFILQLKEGSHIFTMSLSGAIRPLIQQPVSSYWFAHDRMYFLIHRLVERKSVIKIMKVKDSNLVEEGQLQSQYGSALLFVNAEQIILGRR